MFILCFNCQNLVSLGSSPQLATVSRLQDPRMWFYTRGRYAVRLTALAPNAEVRHRREANKSIIFHFQLGSTLGRRFVDIHTREQGFSNLMIGHILCQKLAVWTNVLIVWLQKANISPRKSNCIVGCPSWWDVGISQTLSLGSVISTKMCYSEPKKLFRLAVALLDLLIHMTSILSPRRNKRRWTQRKRKLLE